MLIDLVMQVHLMLAITNKNAWNYTWENILSYNTTIAKDHNIGGSVITS